MTALFVAAALIASSPVKCRKVSFDARRARVLFAEIDIASDRSGESRFMLAFPGGVRIMVSARHAKHGAVSLTNHTSLVYSADREYLAVSGVADDVDVTDVSVSLTFKNIVFVEWDFAADHPMPGGACIRAETLKLTTR